MSTGLTKLTFSSKRLLGKEDFETRFFGYLKDSIKQTNQAYSVSDMILNGSFTFDDDGNDKFKIEKSATTTKAIDANGEILDPALSPADAYVEDVDFPNTNTIPYYVGLQHADLPSKLAINPRTGMPEWIEQTETIGVTDEPDSVVDNGNGTLTANLDTICGGLDCSGRTAVIFQSDLARGVLVFSEALETLTVSWSGSANTITTAGMLGQAAISTTAADYTIVLLGPIVRGTTGIKTQDGVVYVGKITGNGPAATPTAFDYTDQRSASSLSSIFADGLGQDLLPAIDDTYDIGDPLYRWANLYVTNLNLGGNMLPALHNTYDLGENATRWQDLYLSGTLHVTGNWEGHFLPSSDKTYDIGADPDRWRNFYLSSDAGEGVGSDLVPMASSTYNLGASAYKWSQLHIGVGAAEGVAGQFKPTVTESYALGANNYRWSRMYMSNEPGDGYNDVVPMGAGNSLGNEDYPWAGLWLSTGSGSGVHTDLVPTEEGDLNLGNTDFRWRNLYLDDGTVHNRNAGDTYGGWRCVRSFSAAEMYGIDSFATPIPPVMTSFIFGIPLEDGVTVHFGTQVPTNFDDSGGSFVIKFITALVNNELNGDTIDLELGWQSTAEHEKLLGYNTAQKSHLLETGDLDQITFHEVIFEQNATSIGPGEWLTTRIRLDGVAGGVTDIILVGAEIWMRTTALPYFTDYTE